jgi:hypothetical protein
MLSGTIFLCGCKIKPLEIFVTGKKEVRGNNKRRKT